MSRAAHRRTTSAVDAVALALDAVRDVEARAMLRDLSAEQRVHLDRMLAELQQACGSVRLALDEEVPPGTDAASYRDGGSGPRPPLPCLGSFLSDATKDAE